MQPPSHPPGGPAPQTPRCPVSTRFHSHKGAPQVSTSKLQALLVICLSMSPQCLCAEHSLPSALPGSSEVARTALGCRTKVCRLVWMPSLLCQPDWGYPLSAQLKPLWTKLEAVRAVRAALHCLNRFHVDLRRVCYCLSVTKLTLYRNFRKLGCTRR